MFRTQANAFDQLVAKATDENLTSEPWGDIMIVCDKVIEAEHGARDSIQAVIKRLAHRNANVQLYTLELANALSQNCGIKLHRELASRSFTDALLRLANERNTHQKVKTKILERMADWAQMFKQNPDLGIMEQSYMKLKLQNPHLQPPSQPPKTVITDSDRRKEDEDLRMALELSMSDRQNQQNKPASKPTTTTVSNQQPQSIPQPSHTGTTAATISRVRALYDFNPTESGELQFRKGDIISVLASAYKDWWKGSLHGEIGIFPLNYVEKLQDPTANELEQEAQTESEVFAEIKNVEKLLALLSTSSESGRGDVRDNEEITTLYHQTLAIRPKLIELIGKYSQKKDDFTQLNDKFIKARRTYETLLEQSMSHSAQLPYGGRPQYNYGNYGQAPTTYAGPQANQPYYPPSTPNNQFNRLDSSEQPYQTIPIGHQQAQPTQHHPTQQHQQQHQQQQQQQQQYYAQSNASADDLYGQPTVAANNANNIGSGDRQTHVISQGQANIPFDPRVNNNGPQSAQGGGPQELATSSFDSPIQQNYSGPPYPTDSYINSPPQQLHHQQTPSNQRPTSPPYTGPQGQAPIHNQLSTSIPPPTSSDLYAPQTPQWQQGHGQHIPQPSGQQQQHQQPSSPEDYYASQPSQQHQQQSAQTQGYPGYPGYQAYKPATEGGSNMAPNGGGWQGAPNGTRGIPETFV